MTPDSLLFRALVFYGTQCPHRGQWWVHARLRNICGAKQSAELEVFREGLRWQLNPADLAHENLLWLGTNDPWDLFHLKQYLKPGCVIFDVGANFGYYSITLASYLSRQCRVHAFEPNPPTHERLRTNITLNQLDEIITTHRIGFSDAPGTGHLRANPGNFSGFNSGSVCIGDQPDGVAVPLLTLDDFCGGRQISRLDLLKVDVEGFEERVLRGAADSLARFQPVLCIELNPSTLTRQNSSVKNVAGMLAQFGYKLFVAHRERLEPLLRMPTGGEYLNALCFPPSQLPS